MTPDEIARAYLATFIVEDVAYVTGRGMIIIGHSRDIDINRVPSLVGYKWGSWVIRGVEAMRALMDPPFIKGNVGLLLGKEVKEDGKKEKEN